MGNMSDSPDMSCFASTLWRDGRMGVEGEVSRELILVFKGSKGIGVRGER